MPRIVFVITRWRRIVASALALCVLCSAACANVRVNADGSVTLIGFLEATLPAASVAGAAQQQISATTFGVMLFSTPVGSSLAMGYSRETLTTINADHPDLHVTAQRCNSETLLLQQSAAESGESHGTALSIYSGR
jgi:hypothetical protein